MWPIVNKAVYYLDTVPPLLLLVVVITTMRRTRRDYIVYFIASQFLFNGYANLLNELKKDNLFIYSLNFAWSFYLLSHYFARLYGSYSITWLVFGLVTIYQLYSIVTLQASAISVTFNSVSFGLVSVIITLYCLLYYTRQLAAQPKENILTIRDFWFVNGVFTYYASNFFIFLTYNTLTKNHYANVNIIWKIHNLVFLVMCIYFFIGLQCRTPLGK